MYQCDGPVMRTMYTQPSNSVLNPHFTSLEFKFPLWTFKQFYWIFSSSLHPKKSFWWDISLKSVLLKPACAKENTTRSPLLPDHTARPVYLHFDALQLHLLFDTSVVKENTAEQCNVHPCAWSWSTWSHICLLFHVAGAPPYCDGAVSRAIKSIYQRGVATAACVRLL